MCPISATGIVCCVALEGEDSRDPVASSLRDLAFARNAASFFFFSVFLGGGGGVCCSRSDSRSRRERRSSRCLGGGERFLQAPFNRHGSYRDYYAQNEFKCSNTGMAIHMDKSTIHMDKIIIHMDNADI